MSRWRTAVAGMAGAVGMVGVAMAEDTGVATAEAFMVVAAMAAVVTEAVVDIGAA